MPSLVQRVQTVDEVVATMTRLEEALPRSDGLWWFNHLYLRVTLGVRSAIGSTAFGDPRFLDRLDVAFGNLYFDAVSAGDANPDAAPPAWKPLLRLRQAAGIEPLQFALAGMNAHINRDLPVGIVAVCQELGGAPEVWSVSHDDFERVNGILESVEGQVKGEFLSGALGKIDAATAPLDDRVAMWNVRAARANAWTNAQVLWTLRPTPALRVDYFEKLDRFTGFASRGLLSAKVV
jgi:hypothetical protein